MLFDLMQQIHSKTHLFGDRFLVSQGFALPSVLAHCRFLVPENTQKILTETDTIFGLNMIVKSGLEILF